MCLSLGGAEYRTLVARRGSTRGAALTELDCIFIPVRGPMPSSMLFRDLNLLSSHLRPLALLRAALVLCATWAGPCAVDAQTKAPPPTLQKIRQTGVIVLAHRESSIPFSYFDADKRPVGYALDLCLRVVEGIRRDYKLPNLKVIYLPVSPADRIPSIVEGRADLECGNTTNNAVRRKLVAFTMTHYFAGGRLLVHSKSGVRRLSDLRGKTVVSTRGSTHLAFLNDQVDHGIISVRLLTAKDSDEAFKMLEENRADAFLMDDIVLYSLRANAKEPTAYAVVGDYTTVEPLAIMLRKNDPEFKRYVDLVVTRFMMDGEIQSLYSRWFQGPIPPKGVTLEVPMGALMRDQVRFPSDKVGDDIGG